jgi:HdeA/HdeB family
MKRTIAALLIFGFTPASHAVVIDLSKMTCQEFLASNKDEIRTIWAWLDGYYTEEQDAPMIRYQHVGRQFKEAERILRGESNHRPHYRNQQAVWEVIGEGDFGHTLSRRGLVVFPHPSWLARNDPMEFIAFLGSGAATWPLAARAHHPIRSTGSVFPACLRMRSIDAKLTAANRSAPIRI